MTSSLPTEHLSPTQLKAYSALESDKSIKIQSSSFMALVDILNLIIIDKTLIIACDLHTKRLMEDYRSHHSLVEQNEQKEQLAIHYKQQIRALKESYSNSFPLDKEPLTRQYKSLLLSNELSLADTIYIDPRLKQTPGDIHQTHENLETLIATHKRTWERYEDIDPLKEHFYTSEDQDSLQSYLAMWTTTVKSIRNDMQKGLQQIVDTEKYRILSVKKQLTQHLINYQHSRNEEELNIIKKKIAFILTDLPRNSFKDFSDLVMFAVSNWESATSKYLTKYRRRFNSRNQESVLIFEAIKELKVVLRDIENNGYLKLEIASNPLSYETQILQVEDLLNQLQYCEDWIEDEHKYIAWKRFYLTLDQSEKTYIDTLTSLDSTALSKQLIYIELQNWKEEVVRNGIPTIDRSLAVFEAYKDINATIDWSSILLTSESTKADFHINYNGVIYSLTKASSTQADSTIIIEDKLLNDIKPMVTLDYYNQSNQANYLTTAVVASKAHLRTFQSRSLNIISCLDEVDTTHMLTVLSGNNINELKGESIAELIKGSILDEDKEKVIIVYDELLNVQLTAHYFWQRLVLQSLATAGYKVISINTSDIFEHMGLSKQLAPYLMSNASPYQV